MTSQIPLKHSSRNGVINRAKFHFCSSNGFGGIQTDRITEIPTEFRFIL